MKSVNRIHRFSNSVTVCPSIVIILHLLEFNQITLPINVWLCAQHIIYSVLSQKSVRPHTRT